MVRHIQNYLDHFKHPNYQGLFLSCEVCHRQATEFHHIEIKGMGCGKARRKRLDQVENIICLCADCHRKAHANELSKEKLIEIHNKNL